VSASFGCMVSSKLKNHCSSVAVCYRLRLSVFHLTSPDLSAGVRSDVAMIGFALTRTLQSADLSAKIQATGVTSRLSVLTTK